MLNSDVMGPGVCAMERVTTGCKVSLKGYKCSWQGSLRGSTLFENGGIGAGRIFAGQFGNYRMEGRREDAIAGQTVEITKAA